MTVNDFEKIEGGSTNVPDRKGTLRCNHKTKFTVVINDEL